VDTHTPIGQIALKIENLTPDTANSATSWESKKQQTVALSLTEPEYMAYIWGIFADGAKEVIHMWRFIAEVLSISPVITIFNDNQECQKLAKNTVHHARTKHIDVRHHFIREVVKQELVDLRYKRSKEMPADILTKGLFAAAHRNCTNALGIVKQPWKFKDQNAIKFEGACC